MNYHLSYMRILRVNLKRSKKWRGRLGVECPAYIQYFYILYMRIYTYNAWKSSNWNFPFPVTRLIFPQAIKSSRLFMTRANSQRFSSVSPRTWRANRCSMEKKKKRRNITHCIMLFSKNACTNAPLYETVGTYSLMSNGPCDGTFYNLDDKKIIM